MPQSFKVLTIAIFLMSLLSCGKQEVSEEDNLYAQAKMELNSKNYEQAKNLFFKLNQKYPNNRRYQRLLADSYLGLGGFELFDFLIAMERLLEGSFESEDFLIESRAFIKKYFHINFLKKDNLKNALVIYSEIDSGESNTAKEDRLKKGLVHIFMLSQAMKDLVIKFETPQEMISRDQLKLYYQKIIKKYIIHIDEMIYHLFNAYLNFKTSFSELESFLREIDRAIYDVFGVQFIKIRGNLENMNIEKMTRLFIQYNPEIYKKIMKQIFQTCERDIIFKELVIIEETIIEEYSNHEFQKSALRMVQEVRQYIAHHDENICDTLF
jgi:tetratricopeptide (TPR) repeat protein